MQHRVKAHQHILTLKGLDILVGTKTDVHWCVSVFMQIQIVATHVELYFHFAFQGT